MIRFYAIFCACLLLATTSIAQAQSKVLLKRETLATTAIVLKGMHAEHESFHNFGPLFLRPGPVQLQFETNLSESVSLVGSTLTIARDGEPMRTVPLTRVHQVIKVNLGYIPDGYHAVSLKASLKVAGGGCQGAGASSLWVKVSDAELSWLSFQDRQGLLPLDQVAQKFMAGTRVHLKPPKNFSEAAAVAVLEASAWVTDRGSRLDDREFERVLELVEDPQMDVPQLQSIAQGFRVVADSAHSLHEAVVQLRRPGLLAACQSLTCELSRAEAPALPPPQKPEPRDAVLLLSDVRNVAWVANREGENSLSFRWPRPANWRIVGEPYLDLSIKLPAAFFAQPIDASVHLFLNGEPLDSWVLTPRTGTLNAEGERLRRLLAVVPKRFFEAETWEFQVKARLMIRRSGPCQGGEPLSSWIMVENKSGLYVDRRSLVHAGIGGFFTDALTLPEVSIEVDAWPEVLHFAAMLAPVSRFFPGQHWRRAKRCARCIRLVPPSGPGSELEYEGREGEERWVDREGKAGLPKIPAANTVLVEANANSLSMRLG
ncbi:MAG: hypothetical protein MK135_08125, partial [Polyangiaceae bacterium]|nr:hypothetical protein [Polyangiaceae bacterium]